MASVLLSHFHHNCCARIRLLPITQILVLLVLKNSHFGRSPYRRHSNIEEISTNREEVLSGRIDNVLMNEHVLSQGWHHLLRQTKVDGIGGASLPITPSPVKKSAER